MREFRRPAKISLNNRLYAYLCQAACYTTRSSEAARVYESAAIVLPVLPRLLILLAGVLLSTESLASSVRIPMEMDQPFIESLVREQVFTGQGRSVRINDNGTGCQYLELRQPRVSIGDGLVRLRTDAEARAGRLVGNQCLLFINWRGQLEFDQRPVVGDDRQSVLLRTESWRALTAGGQTDTMSTTVGRWVEQFLPLNLRQTRINLVEPLRQTREFLALVMIQGDAARARALLDSMAIEDVVARNELVTLTLGLIAPTTATVPPQATEAALTEAELMELETRLDAVDTFVTYVIKYLTAAPAVQNMEPLFDVLLELRYELIGILSGPQRTDTDPARALFVSAWNRLTPILHGIAEQQSDHISALRYLTFIAAGDMLQALDGLGPAAGIDISSDGLRRLARILIPDDPRDPLQRDDGVDPELRRSMGFGETLPPPQNTNETSWLNWLFRPAHAAARLDSGMVRKLNNWVPKTADMDVYLPMVRDVLRHVTTQQLNANELDRAFHEVFRNLVLTTAWQESCWRQFVAKQNQRVPLQSGTGDIGVMQINPRVWRGFYDQHGLKWDIVYNARAGADILQHHMLNYAIGKREHSITGKVENLARSTYAAYNGGPRQYDRYRRKDATARAREVDTLFYEKYRTVSSGKDLAVKACFAN